MNDSAPKLIVPQKMLTEIPIVAKEILDACIIKKQGFNHLEEMRYFKQNLQFYISTF